jgi:hypothetical protein
LRYLTTYAFALPVIEKRLTPNSEPRDVTPVKLDFSIPSMELTITVRSVYLENIQTLHLNRVWTVLRKLLLLNMDNPLAILAPLKLFFLVSEVFSAFKIPVVI